MVQVMYDEAPMLTAKAIAILLRLNDVLVGIVTLACLHHDGGASGALEMASPAAGKVVTSITPVPLKRRTWKPFRSTKRDDVGAELVHPRLVG